eukprot:TRINITY_DN2240_c0_g1_i1.p1 TRINITY_DN2240_c0_g1~~TRINITY_DN2240_c0_g1_i1.p1  ORF type:complete len:181 (+),score=1.12 TRINITY_DN2240_c0_g1_i1:431-973(+)
MNKVREGERNKPLPHQILRTERGLDPSHFKFFSKLEIGLKPSKSRLLRSFIFIFTLDNHHVTKKVQSPSRYKFKLFLRRVFFRSLSLLKINMFSSRDSNNINYNIYIKFNNDVEPALSFNFLKTNKDVEFAPFKCFIDFILNKIIFIQNLLPSSLLSYNKIFYPYELQLYVRWKKLGHYQ